MTTLIALIALAFGAYYFTIAVSELRRSINKWHLNQRPFPDVAIDMVIFAALGCVVVTSLHSLVCIWIKP
jgi:hypothetical protein